MTKNAESVAERVEKRLRAEWPGVRTTAIHGISEYPSVRRGGATDALIKLAAKIAGEEAAR